jgi:hypothetical protein
MIHLNLYGSMPPRFLRGYKIITKKWVLIRTLNGDKIKEIGL